MYQGTHTLKLVSVNLDGRHAHQRQSLCFFALSSQFSHLFLASFLTSGRAIFVCSRVFASLTSSNIYRDVFWVACCSSVVLNLVYLHAIAFFTCELFPHLIKEHRLVHDLQTWCFKSELGQAGILLGSGDYILHQKY